MLKIAERKDSGLRLVAPDEPPADQKESGQFQNLSDPALAAAVEDVLSNWVNERGDAADREEMEQLLGTLARALTADSSVSLEPARSPLGRHLLELIRARHLEHLEQNSGSLQAGCVIERMQRFEAVREQLDPDWSEHLSTKLSGPGGLELVVQVAHDLRSPLTSILFLAETLQKGQSGPVNDVQRRQLGLIYSAALGLSSVTSDVIELARGGDDLVDEHPSPFSVSEILESVRDIVRPIAEEKDLFVSLTSPEVDHRLGHPLAISRVVLNLTVNALKFTSEGGVEIKAESRGRTTVAFSVTDSGPGINPEALDSLYQPFRRSRGRNGYAVSGTGLGLAISRKLVEAMDATLELDTDPSWGTRFSFDLNLPPASQGL